MNKRILTSVLLCTAVVPAIASDHEFLTVNPYGKDAAPNVVIGVERTRETPIKSEVKTYGVATPVEKMSSKPETEPAPRMTNAEPPVVEANAVVSNVDQPKVLAAQRVLEGTPQAFLMVSKPTDRVFVSEADGQVYFHANKATLKSNLEALFGATEVVLPLVWEVSNQHQNPTDVWVHGETTLDVMNALLISYVDPHPIRSETYTNGIVRIFYDKKNRRN